MVLRRNFRKAYIGMMTFKVLVLAALVALSVVECARADGLYISPGGVSYHADRSKGYNEVNHGFSGAWKLDDSLAISGGRYRNSLGDWSTFIAGRWTPVQVGVFRAGALAGVVTGYAANGGGPIPMALPAVAAELGPVEVTVIAWPAMAGSGAGIAAHFAWRVW